jgi:benzoylformate decarboxylase
VKWAAEVGRVEDVPTALRRAVQTALTPPTGPVFLALPLDVQTARADVDVTMPTVPDPHIRPSLESLERAAGVLARAVNPGILVGSRICEAGAVAELIAVAELLGAPVIHEATTSHGRCSFPPDHPLFAEPLPFWSPEVRARLAEFDAILVAGMKLMQQYIYHEPARPIPEHVPLVQVDDDAWELGKNYPLAAPVRGHPKPALAELAHRLGAAMSPDQTAAARARCNARSRAHADARAALRREAESLRDVRPAAPLWLMEQLARVLPNDAAVIEESPTTTGGYLERVGALRNWTGYFAHRGWALGWGLNAAIGVKLAWPDRPVLALIGDGSALYGIQGLWTAARHRIPVTFVITNNRQYKILKQCADVLGLGQAATRHDVGLDVVAPDVDYVGLSQSLGVAARRIAEPEQLAEAVRESLGGDRPQLFEIPIDGGAG